jgi:hypothetical protein
MLQVHYCCYHCAAAAAEVGLLQDWPCCCRCRCLLLLLLLLLLLHVLPVELQHHPLLSACRLWVASLPLHCYCCYLLHH